MLHVSVLKTNTFMYSLHAGLSHTINPVSPPPPPPLHTHNYLQQPKQFYIWQETSYLNPNNLIFQLQEVLQSTSESQQKARRRYLSDGSLLKKTKEMARSLIILCVSHMKKIILALKHILQRKNR